MLWSSFFVTLVAKKIVLINLCCRPCFIITMSLGIYFEVKDAEIYGGEGTVGYAATIVDISLSGLQKADFTKYAESQKEGMAQFCHVPVEKVRVISRDEYEENTD